MADIRHQADYKVLALLQVRVEQAETAGAGGGGGAGGGAGAGAGGQIHRRTSKSYMKIFIYKYFMQRSSLD